MEVKQLSKEEYNSIFNEPYHCFNSADFNSMNAQARSMELLLLGFRTKKYKLGLIGSVKDRKFKSPFSAPFGGFSYTKDDVGLEVIDEALKSFVTYCSSNDISSAEVTLPPLFYDVSFISKMGNGLYRSNFSVFKSDLNYSIHLDDNITHYFEHLHYNAKKNLNIALAKEFKFLKCEMDEEKALAYEIIRKNREAKGYPLRMSFEDVKNTIKIIAADFFLVHLDENAVAAAMVFHVTSAVVQVVYWGDLPEYAHNKTMNYLSYQIVDYYYKTQIKVIDIGPSTENSIPNYGLCNFKESIGCKVFSKLSWTSVF